MEEGVADRELRLAGEAGGWPPDHESLALERGEAGGDPLVVEGRADWPLPEDAARHRRLLQDASLSDRQGVHPGGEQ